MPVEPREFKEEPIEQVASNFVELGLTSDSLGQNFDGIVEGLGLVNFPQEKKEKLLDRMRRIEGAMVNEDPNALTTSVSFEDGTLEQSTDNQQPTFTLGGEADIKQFPNTFDLSGTSVALIEDDLDQEELSLGQAISEASSIDEVFSIFGELQQATPRGFSPNFDFARESNKESHVSTFSDMQPTDLVNEESISELKDDIAVEETKSDLQLHLEETAFNLSNLDVSVDSKVILSRLANEFTPLYFNRSISELLRAKSAEALESTTIGEKIDEGALMLADAYGLQERFQQAKTLSKLAGKELDLRYYRSDLFAEVIEEQFDTQSFQEQFTILRALVANQDAVDKALGFRSSLVASMVWEDLNVALTQGELGHDDWVSWVEAASTVPVLGWLIGTPKRLKAFTKALAVNTNTYRNYLHGVSTSEQLERDMEAVAEFQRMFNPDDNSANVERIIKEERIDVTVENPLAELQSKADTGVTRGERKKLEATKKDLAKKKDSVKSRSVSAEARELSRTTKVKFKDAKKKVKEQIDNELADIEAQEATLQTRINQADEAFKAKQEVSRAKTKGVPERIEKVDKRTIIRVQNGKLGDVTSAYSPNMLKSAFHSSDDVEVLTSVARSQGYTPEDIITATSNKVPDDVTEGINPTLVAPDTHISTRDISGDNGLLSPKLIAERNLKDLLSAEEQKATIDTAFQNVVGLINNYGVLRVDHSLTTDVDANTVRSIGRIGKDETRGFDSFELALLASKNVPEKNVKVVVKHTGKSKFSDVGKDLGVEGLEYYVQVEKNITFDADDALDFTDTTTKYNANWFNELFLEPVDKLDRNIVKAVSFLRNIDNSLVKKLDKVIEPFTKASSEVRAEASKLLVLGDMHEAELTLDVATTTLGRPVREDDAAWLAYGAVNRYYKEVGVIRNWRERGRLVKDGFKNSSIKDSEGRDVFVRLMPSNEAKAAVSNGETKVWDTVKGEEVLLTEEMLDTGLNGRAILKTNTVINREGKSYNIVIGDVNDLDDLPSQVIPMRKGHVDLFYDDVGAIIKVKGNSVINGKLEKGGASKVLRLAPSEKDANVWLGEKAEGSRFTNRELLEQELDLEAGEELTVELSREAKLEAGVVDTSWNGNVKPYNLRKRGEEPVQSISGAAQVMTLEDRLVKSHNALSSRFSRDGVDIIKNRWLNTWGQYLKDPHTLPEDLKTGLAKQFPSEQVRNDAQNILNYIHDQERMLGWRKDNEIVNGIDSALSVINKVPFLKDLAPASRIVMDTARWVAIYGRANYQMLVNTAGIGLQVIQRDPVRGTATMLQSIGSVHGLSLTRNGKKIQSDILAKMYGFDDASDFNDFLEGVRSGGIFSTAQLDNLIAGTHSNRLHIAKNAFAKHGMRGLSIPKYAVSWSTDMGHLIAYRHAVKLIKEKGMNPYKGKGRIEADAMWQDLTQRMNKSSPLATETNEYSKVIALFTQHVMKGWKDTVLQPLVKTVSGKDISKNPSIWADSYQQAFVSTAMNIGLYGVAGVVGKATLDKLGITDDLDEALVEGSIDLAIAHATGQDMDVSSRVSYGDAIGMFFSLTELDTMTLNLLGAGDMALSKVGRFASNLKVGIFNTPLPDDVDLSEFARFMATEGAAVFSGYSDYRKAKMVKDWGLYFNNSGVPKMQVDPDSYLSVLFSFAPDRIQEDASIVYDNEPEEKVEDYYLKTVPDLYVRFGYWKMSHLEAEGKLDYDAFLEIHLQVQRITSGALASLGASNLNIRARRRVAKNLIFPKDIQLPEKMRLKVRAMLDRIIDMHGYNEAKKKFEMLIGTSDDPNVITEATRSLEMLNNQAEILNNGK